MVKEEKKNKDVTYVIYPNGRLGKLLKKFPNYDVENNQNSICRDSFYLIENEQGNEVIIQSSYCSIYKTFCKSFYWQRLGQLGLINNNTPIENILITDDKIIVHDTYQCTQTHKFEINKKALILPSCDILPYINRVHRINALLNKPNHYDNYLVNQILSLEEQLEGLNDEYKLNIQRRRLKNQIDKLKIDIENNEISEEEREEQINKLSMELISDKLDSKLDGLEIPPELDIPIEEQKANVIYDLQKDIAYYERLIEQNKLKIKEIEEKNNNFAENLKIKLNELAKIKKDL